MNKRRIGTTALDVTEISFGGAAIGGLYRACPRDVAMETLQTAWDAGLRYFDTAPASVTGPTDGFDQARTGMPSNSRKSVIGFPSGIALKQTDRAF